MSQFWKQKLGDYSISKDLGCPRPGCRSYRVHLNDKFYPFFTADVYQLNDTLNMHRLEEIVSEKKQWIDEIFVVTKNQREYMAVVYNSKKVLAESMYLEKIRMTSANCKRLMIEALQLIKELHKMGVRFNCLITKFIQTQIYKSQLIFNIIKFRSNRADEQLGKQDKQFVDELRRNETEGLLWLYKYLMTVVRTENGKIFTHPQTDRIIILLLQALKDDNKNNMSTEDKQKKQQPNLKQQEQSPNSKPQENKERKVLEEKYSDSCSIQKIEKLLCEMAVKKEEFSFYCRLLTQGKGLFVEISNEKTGKTVTYQQKKPFKINNWKQMNAQDVYYELSMLLPDQIRVISESQVEYGPQKSQNIIKFDKEEQEAYQEYDQVKVIKDPWEKEEEYANELDVKVPKQISVENGSNKRKQNNGKNQSNQSQNSKNQNNIIQYQKNIVKVKSVYYYQRSPLEVEGIGTLICGDLVLTCAHNLYYKWCEMRREAVSVAVEIQGKQVDIAQGCWLFSQRFRQAEKRKYDYALIKLTQRVNIEPFCLSYDYKQIDRSIIANTKKEQDDNMSNKFQQMASKGKMDIQRTLKYKVKFSQGNSGEPLFAISKKINGQCCVIGIHMGRKQDDGYKHQYNRTSVMITKAVKDQLIQFQKKLNKTTFSIIEMCSLFFENINTASSQDQLQINKIRKRVENNFRQFSIISQHRKQNMDSSLRKLQQKSQLYVNLRKQENYLMRSIFSSDKRKLVKLREGKKYKQLWEQFALYCAYIEENSMFNVLKYIVLLNYVASENFPLSDIQSSEQYIIQQMQRVEQIIGRELKWQAYAYTMSKKMDRREGKQSLPNAQYLLQSVLVEQKLHQLIGLQMQYQYTIKIQMVKHFVTLQKLLGPKQAQLAPEHSKGKQFPFSSFQLIRKDDNEHTNKIQECKWVVEFESRQLRNITFWYLCTVNHKSFFHLPLRRTNEQKYNISAIFLMSNTKTIAACLQHNYLSVAYWLSVMLQMAEFATHLHQQQQSISTVIEQSMLICQWDKKHPYPLFYYVQPFQALQYHCLRINPHKYNYENKHFPWCQIFSPRPRAAQQVDVWMMGKLFERIADGWKPFHDGDREVEKALRTVIQNMVTAPQHRFTMAEVLPYLREYLLNYHFSPDQSENVKQNKITCKATRIVRQLKKQAETFIILNSSNHKSVQMSTNQKLKDAENEKSQYKNSIYNSVVRIKSIIYLSGMQIQVEGNGILIEQDLVLTAACNIFFKWNKYCSRKQAEQVHVTIPDQEVYKVNRQSWIISQKFRQTQRKRYHYALIKIPLSNELKNSKRFKNKLNLTYGLSKKSRVLLIKSKTKQQSQSSRQPHFQESKIDLSQQKYLIKHKMTTQKGDSGSPLVVQPQGMNGLVQLVGFHISGKYSSDGFKFQGNNTAIRITKDMVKQLARFEKQLTSQNISLIQETSLNYAQIKERSDNHHYYICRVRQKIEKDFQQLSTLCQSKNKQTQFGYKLLEKKAATKKNKEKQSFVANHTIYPYNCIVQIKYILIVDDKKTEVRGKGARLSPNFIITCAHVLFLKKTKNCQMKELMVKVGEGNWMNVDRKNYAIPQEFLERQDQEYDFALIKLKINMDQRYCLSLLIDAHQSMKIMLPKIQSADDSKVMVQQSQMSVEDMPMLSHNFVTKKGDSGTPLLTKIEDKYYIIGIHSQDSMNHVLSDERIFVERPKGVRITQEVLKGLQKLQKKLMQEEEYTSFENQVIKYSEYFNSVKESKKFISEDKVTQLLSLYQLKEKAEQYVQISSEIRALERSVFNKDQKKLKILKESKQYLKAREYFQKYCLTKQDDDFFCKIKKFVMVLHNISDRHISVQNLTKQKLQLQIMEQIQESYGKEIKWDNYAWSLSLSKSENKQFLVALNFWSLSLQNMFVEDKLHELIGLRLPYEYNIQTYLAIKDEKIKKIYKNQQLNSYTQDYKSQGKQILKFQFQSRQIKNETFWRILSLDHMLFCPLRMRRSATEYAIKDNILTIFCQLNPWSKSISECLDSKILSAPKWLSLMMKMTQFATYLHSQNLSLSTLIQSTVFINIQDIEKPYPTFFYFQSFSALQYQYSLLSLHQKQDNINHYPLKQIMSKHQSNPDKVDVWMMGKTFQRIINKIDTKNHIDKKIKQSVEDLVINMIREPHERLEMGQVWSIMYQYNEKIKVQHLLKKI